ncbi:MAG: PAS domain-containing protein [Candidatus Marinimicrobia bacterium]|nr:PAS domain-containing protein [Candidatus Neomarinimicrobiota bacterium]
MDTYKEAWEKILQESEFAWWEWDISKNTVIHNDLKARMLDYDPEYFKGKGYQGFTELVHPNDYEKTMDAMRNVLSGKTKLYQIDYRIRTRGGYYVWFMDRGIVTQRDAEGKPKKIRGIVIDLGRESKRGTDIDALIAVFNRSASSADGAYSFLTICSICYRIKKANTEWIALRDNIFALIGERISHGICPDCMRRLYPDIAEEVLAHLEEKD